jgi:hypothetical protein
MLIDNDDNPATPNVTRRQAYTTLMVASRAYLRSAVGRGHAPNQDVSDQWAALVANEALRLLSPDQVWPADRLLLLMNQSLGLLPQPNCTGLAFWEECTATLPNSLWISPLGMSMEPHGSLQGGYSDGYGDENLGRSRSVLRCVLRCVPLSLLRWRFLFRLTAGRCSVCRGT